MPQSRNVRVNEISQHPEHTAERAGASHLNPSHDHPEGNKQKHDEHVVPPAQQHEGVPQAKEPTKKKHS